MAKTEQESAEDKTKSYANGVRKAREDKGYSRRTLCEAFAAAGQDDITRRYNFNMETSDDAAEVKKYIAKIKALPDAVKVVKEKPAKAAKATKAPAKKAAPKASDLI